MKTIGQISTLFKQLISNFTGSLANTQGVEIYRGPHFKLVYFIRCVTAGAVLFSGPALYSWKKYQYCQQNNLPLDGFAERSFARIKEYAFQKFESKLPPSALRFLDSKTSIVHQDVYDIMPIQQHDKWIYSIGVSAMTLMAHLFVLYCTAGYVTSIRIPAAVCNASLKNPLQQLLGYTIASGHSFKKHDFILIGDKKSVEETIMTFRETPMLVTRIGWPAMPRTDQITPAQLVKCRKGFTGDRHLFASVKSRDRFYNLDFDVLKETRPKLWIAFHSAIPWSK